MSSHSFTDAGFTGWTLSRLEGPPDLGVPFSFFGKFRAGRAILFRQPLNSLSVRFVFGNCPYGEMREKVG